MNDKTQIAVDVRDAVKRYGDFTALQKISLGIRDNEFFTLLGPSGCGKTTLLRMIAGFEDVTEGAIFLYGDEIESLPPHQRPVNTVFQNYALFPHMTILDNVGFGLEMRGASKADARRKAGEMLELVQLSPFSGRKPSQLSGGQQQRVALARALAPSPKVLLLDEPLSALDLKPRKAMQIELKHIQRETGITFIFVTHDQEEALTMADRIVVMNQGVIEQVGSPTQIYREPANLFVADFIGEMNQLPATARGKAGISIGADSDIVKSQEHQFADGETIVAAIRPEDVIPHANGSGTPDEADVIGDPENVFTVLIAEMEFLGSFWRCRLQNEYFGESELIADLSINAVRRFELEAGKTMVVELPQNRLMAFPRSEAS